jgi:hypothetical protein
VSIRRLEVEFAEDVEEVSVTMLTNRKLLLMGRGFLPSDLAGLVVWHDASDASTLFQDSALTTPANADNDPVGGWKDKSGNGRTATQTTAGKRPLLKLAIRNGLPGLRFDDTDDYLSLAKITAFATEASVFAVSTSAKATEYRTLEFENDGTNPHRFILRHMAGGDQYHFYTSHSGGNVQDNIAVGNGLAIWGGVATEGASVFSHKNTTIGAGGAIGTFASGGANGPVYGAGDDGTGTAFLNGDLFEVVAYSRALNSTEVAKLKVYLQKKWATP